MEGTKLHNAVSTVKLEVGKEEHGGNVTCLATHETYCEGEPATCPVTATILLMVKYKPELTITQVSKNFGGFFFEHLSGKVLPRSQCKGRRGTA